MAAWHHVAMPHHTIRVGTFTRSLLIDLARKSGALDDAGLDVVETSVASSPAQFASLENEEFDVVFTSPDNVLAYRFLAKNPLGRLLPVQILGALDRGLGLSLCLAPSIRDPGEVRGGVVGVDVAQSGFAFVAYALLEQAGLRQPDYSIEALGSTPRRADALVANECAATVLNAGNELRAVGAGCTIVSTVATLGPYLGTVVASLVADDRARLELRRRFISVLLATVADVRARTNESIVVNAATALLGLSQGEAREHYSCLLQPTCGLVGDGMVDRASIETLLELRRRYLPTRELDSIMGRLSDVVAPWALA